MTLTRDTQDTTHRRVGVDDEYAAIRNPTVPIVSNVLDNILFADTYSQIVERNIAINSPICVPIDENIIMYM
jgi:hypothetical protein